MRNGGVEICAALQKGSAAFEALAKGWVGSFAKDGPAAIVDMVNLLVCCAGAKENALEQGPNLSLVEADEEDWDEILSEIQATLELGMADKGPQVETKYPIISNAKPDAKLRRNLGQWWSAVVKECRRGNTYNYGLLEGAVTVLNVLSSSNITSLRHTATTCTFDLTSGLVGAAAELAAKAALAERQLEAETKKSPVTKAKKTKELLERVAALKDSTASLEAVIGKAFQGVWVLRNKDHRSVMRKESFVALSNWLTMYPGMFLSDTYLKYFGWGLSDKQIDVREAVVRALHAIYSASTIEGGQANGASLSSSAATSKGVQFEKLQNFTARFLPRIFEMAYDTSEVVAVEAVKVLRLLLYEGAMAVEEISETVKDDDIDKVDSLVFDVNCNKELRREAMLFALCHMDAFATSDGDFRNGDAATAAAVVVDAAKAKKTKRRKGKASDDVKVSNDDVQKRAGEQLDELLAFCDTHVGQNYFTVDLLVEAMAGTKEAELLKDWGAITARLLQDCSSSGQGPAGHALSEERVLILARIFCKSAQLFCEADCEVGDDDVDGFSSFSLDEL